MDPSHHPVGRRTAIPTATDAETPSPEAVAAIEGMREMVVIPTSSTDGVLSIVIPAGMDAAMKRSGDAAYHMPPVIRLKVGDTIVIRNDDTAPHMLL